MIGEFKEDWIKIKIDNDCIIYAESFGQHLVGNNFTTSQIRNVFGEIKRIQLSGFSENQTDFLLLRPKMAYASKRALNSNRNSTGATVFEKVLKAAHIAVAVGTEGDSKRFENFCDFIEAILAYHKAAGGRD
jgi:CRISPR-associated protein Csm2